MFDRFQFYRHRRLLPFAAVFALVCINGATLAPFCPPQPLFSQEDGSPRKGEAAPAVDADSWRFLQYEQGSGDEPGTVVVAGPPPIVKNLRRVSPSRHAAVLDHRTSGQLDDCRAPGPEFMQRALVANAADLSRLCRLIL